MTYEERISLEKNLTIEKIIDISNELLPLRLRERPWENLVHGTNLLSTDEQLCRYMLAYGEMHEVKCRAAFQHFPFDKLISNIEIVDWGCGQGLATCVALDIIKDRGLFDQVKKITLIEPSSAALARAKANVAHIVRGGSSIHTINKYLPCYTDELDSVKSYQAEMPYVIHLFSNILDIPTVNIEKLAKMLISSGTNNFVLCMGPMNPNKWRLKAFADYFHGAEFFSNIYSTIYGYTTRTLHSFGCRTQGFEFSSSTTQWDGLNGYENKNMEIEQEYIDDYSPVTKRFSKDKEFSESLLSIYEKIHDQLNPTDVLLLRPNISGDTPDIVLFRPKVGIVLFDVHEDQIPMKFFDEANAQNLKDEDRKTATQNLENKCKEMLEKVSSYENRLIDLHITNLREKVFENYSFLNIIRKAVIFVHNTKEEIEKFYGNLDRKGRYYTDLLSGSDLDKIESKLGITRKRPEFTDEFASSFKSLLASPWHSYKEGRAIKLTTGQQRLSVSKEGVHFNVVSCAGSGKTEVLAHRAIDANIRTGQPVLILTYNIALRNYIKYRLGQVAADFNWTDYVILNYHEFFNSQAINCGIAVHSLDAYQDLDYFKKIKTKRYAAIFIDEAQDYESSWLTIIYKHFLKRGGEMVLFEDGSQDLYHRKVDKEAHQIKFEKKLLRKGASSECRFKNDAIFNLVQAFAIKYNLGIEEQPTLGLFGDSGVIKYALIDSSSCNAHTYGYWVDKTINEYGLLRDKCAVIAVTQDMLQSIDLSYRYITKAKTVTTFPTSEQYDKMKSMRASAFAAQEKSLERTKKLHFSMSREGLKLSTVYSFKGWEADSIMLFIQKPEPVKANYDRENPKPIEAAPGRALCPEVIYTALSRARVNLFVFNLGNEQYHDFFKNQIS